MSVAVSDTRGQQVSPDDRGDWRCQAWSVEAAGRRRQRQSRYRRRSVFLAALRAGRYGAFLAVADANDRACRLREARRPTRRMGRPRSFSTTAQSAGGRCITVRYGIFPGYVFAMRRATGVEVSSEVEVPITVCNCHDPTSAAPKLPENVHPPLASVTFP